MKVRVNQDACVGCGACTSVAEDLFKMNDEGYSEAINETVPADKEQQARDAIDTCPTSAIEEVEE